jgi:hypothetical protein
MCVCVCVVLCVCLLCFFFRVGNDLDNLCGTPAIPSPLGRFPDQANEEDHGKECARLRVFRASTVTRLQRLLVDEKFVQQLNASLSV